MKFVAALRFLTVLPVTTRRDATAMEVGASIVYFPLVGLAIGVLLGVLDWLLVRVVPPSLANGLVIVASVLVNGALHLDGFIDTCDGLAGNKPPEERRRIMKDSRVGAFGVVGGILLLLLKYASLNSIPQSYIIASLVIMPLMARWLMVFAIVGYPYAKPEGLGVVFKQEASWRRFAIATLGAFVAASLVLFLRRVSFFFLPALAVMAGTWLIAIAWLGHLNKKFGGLTGDSYGAVSELSEVTTLMILSALAYNQWMWMA